MVFPFIRGKTEAVPEADDLRVRRLLVVKVLLLVGSENLNVPAILAVNFQGEILWVKLRKEYENIINNKVKTKNWSNPKIEIREYYEL